MNGNLQSRIERNRDGNEIEMKRNEMNPNELETPWPWPAISQRELSADFDNIQMD